MGVEQPQSPPGVEWVDLTDELLRSERGERWCELAINFEPPDNEEAERMAGWLRECIKEKSMPLRTRAAASGDVLLGFYSVATAYYRVSNRSRATLAFTRLFGHPPDRGLLISSIVRSELAGPGFGRSLLEDAVGLALQLESPDEPITAILVEPANEKLVEMWEVTYHFAPLEGSNRLHFPIKVPEELEDV
jgi:hypothetical protein